MTEPASHPNSPDPIDDPTASTEPRSASGGGAIFPSTRWSMVAAAGSDRTRQEQALEQLCRDYWKPLYIFIRSRVRSVEEARDLTQCVLADLVHRDSFSGLSAEKGRFRTFLLRCAKNRLAVDRRAAMTQKRGGGMEHFSIDTEEGEACVAALASKTGGDGASPDVVFERQWSAHLLERVMEQLADQFRAKGEGEKFEPLWPLVAGGEDRGRYGELADELGVTEANLRMIVFRLRKRYRRLLREEIAQTVIDPDDVDDEINHLMRLYGRD